MSANVLEQALSAHRSGNLDQAAGLYRQILAADPRNFDALHMLGIISAQHGQYIEAEKLLQTAFSIDPNVPPCCQNYGSVLSKLRKFDKAVEVYQRGVKLAPNYPPIYSDLGAALIELGRLEEAVASFDKAIAMFPRFAVAYHNRAEALKRLRHFERALTDINQAIALNPNYAEAFSNRCSILALLGRVGEALASCDQAIALDRRLPGAHLVRGRVLHLLNRNAEALASNESAIELAPGFSDAWTLKGRLSMALGDPQTAAAAFEQALGLNPRDAIAISGKIFLLDFDPKAGTEAQQAARRLWWQQIGQKIPRVPPRPKSSEKGDGRITLGYVSSDFREHSAAECFRSVLRNHDRQKFKVVCYSCSTVEDAGTLVFKAAADQWRDASRWSDTELAAEIQADRIDILIDLSGHTEGNRLEVFARKPAPIQITAWGSATGTGLATIDYLFADPVSIPAHERAFFTESIYDLPCVIFADPIDDIPVDNPPCLANGYITFGVFNRASKISDDAVAAWAAILGNVPQSRLIFKDGAFDDKGVAAALIEKFSKQGIDPARIGCLGRTPRNDHLRAFGQIDISLDPFPQNGGISAWEALRMGVPVVALLGRTVSSRAASAILTSIGKAEWSASTVEDYIVIASRLAASPDALAKIRSSLRDEIRKSSSGNVVAYTAAVEKAYATFWSKQVS